MTAKTKKIVIASVIGAVSIAGALAYLQYKKLMNYVIKVNKVLVKKISMNLIDIDLYLNFTNKSDIAFTIVGQKYDIYLNNVFVTKIENKAPNEISAKGTSVIGLNVSFNPKEVSRKLGPQALTILSDTSKLRIKIDMKLKVKLWFFTVNIPYTYEDTLKNMMSSNVS